MLLFSQAFHSFDLDKSVKIWFIDSCISVMPPLFASVLHNNRGIIIDSFSEGITMLGGQYPHISAKTRQGLIDTMDHMKAELIKSIKSGPDFRDLSRSYGIIAAYAFHINNPLSYMNPDDYRKAVLAREYQGLVRFHNPKIRIFFYGFYSYDCLIGGQVLQELSLKLLESFVKDQNSLYPHNYFDERSIPFGIAQMHLNASFSFATVYWFSIWKDGGGYVKDSPFYNISPEKPGQFLAILN